MTFVAGLLPVVGNLISNTVIVIVGLSIRSASPLASLAFLIVIHKLEYFLNARIVGTQIGSHTWELLLAMLVMEAAFGVGRRRRRADLLRVPQGRAQEPRSRVSHVAALRTATRHASVRTLGSRSKKRLPAALDELVVEPGHALDSGGRPPSAAAARRRRVHPIAFRWPNASRTKSTAAPSSASLEAASRVRIERDRIEQDGWRSGELAVGLQRAAFHLDPADLGRDQHRRPPGRFHSRP